MKNYMAGLRSVKEVNDFENRYRAEIPNGKPLFENLLFSIASVGKITRYKMLDFLEQGKAEGKFDVALDSGGYQVAKGKLSVADMMLMDREIYSKYSNFDAYFLPDSPLFANDDKVTADRKIAENIKMAVELFETLPAKVRAKSVAIFHLQNISQMEQQIEGFEKIVNESGYIAISSVGLGTKFDQKVRLVSELQSAYGHNIKIHSLGDGSTKRLLALDMVGIFSNDTTSAHITAAIGKVVMPLIGSVHLDNISLDSWDAIQMEANHSCEFCDDFISLKNSVKCRKLHNLIVYRDLPEQYAALGKENLSSDFYYLKQQELF